MDINTPAATAEPITPEIFDAMQYCKTLLVLSCFRAISLATREAIGNLAETVYPALSY